MDPRPQVISKRFAKIRNIIAVAGAKGGVGKSSLSSLLALDLANKGYKTGLLDLDFYGPCSHLILGIEQTLPEEDQGIIPPTVKDIKFMSMFYYSEDRPTPMRGTDISNSILELLAITQWGELDFLIMDMPPGIGEATLDAIRYIQEIKFLLVTTPSKVSFGTTAKLIKLLKKIDKPILGLIENLKSSGQTIKDKAESSNIEYLGEIKYDNNLESSLANKELLLKTDFIKDLDKIFTQSLKQKMNAQA